MTLRNSHPENFLKLQVMVVILCCLIILLILGSYIFYQINQKHIQENINDTIKGVDYLFEQNVEQEAQLLHALVKVITDDESLILLLEDQNQSALLNKYREQYKYLSEKFDITHFYFSNHKRENILRLHHPVRFGDTINRYTTLQAEKTKDSFYGVELGKFGQLTLRFVKPIYRSDILVGFVEIGKEIEHFVKNIQTAIPVDILVTIYKKYLDKETWEEGMGVLDRQGQWDQYQDSVLIDSTFATLEEAYDALPPEKTHSYSQHGHENEEEFADIERHDAEQFDFIYFLPIYETSGREVGDLVLRLDYQEVLGSIQDTTARIVIVGIAVIFIMLMILYGILNRGQRAITQYRKQLVSSESNLKEAQGMVKLGSWELDLTSNNLIWSDEVFNIIEIDKNKFSASHETFLETIHPEDRESVNAAYADSIINKTDYELEHRLLMKDGRTKYVIEQGYSTYDENDNPVRSIGTILDITDRKDLEYNLQKSEERFRDIVESTNDWIWETDAEGRYTYVSGDARGLLGYEISELIGKTPFDCMPPEEAERVAKVFADIVENKRAFRNLVNVNLHKCGAEVILESSGRPIIGKNGELFGYRGADRDITEIKKSEIAQLEKEKAEARARLKSEFLANMSHEIRTPMNAIIGMSDLALKTGLNPQQKNYIHKVNLSAKNLLGIINDILDFSKIESGNLGIEKIPFNLDDVVEQSANLIRMQSKDKHIDFNIDYPASIPCQVIGDPLRIGQILINLGNNAVKFTDDYGEITYEIRSENETPDEAQLLFSVKDNGIGISEDHQKVLFQSFNQADLSTTRKYGGTGLGLAISRTLVEMMGGRIWAESKLGEGSVFYFQVTLPLQQKIEQHPHQDIRPLRSLRVLVVEDCKTALLIHQSMLKSLGTEVECVDQGKKALQKIKECDASKPYTHILLDCYMEGMNGLDLAKQVTEDKNIQHKPKIIIVTGLKFEDTYKLINDLPTVISVLDKPLLIHRLEEELLRSIGINSDTGNDKVASKTKEFKFSNERILLVEDNDINQELALDLLTSAGLQVDIANEGAEALKKVSQQAYDGVLMDCQMPVMDGFEATRKMRKIEQYNSLPIIAFTANIMKEDIDRIKDSGMDDHIGKPIDPETMFKTLAKWIKPTITE